MSTSTTASNSGFNWNTDTWQVIDSYFNQNKVLTEHQINSYNDFIDNIIPQIIERNNPIVISADYNEKTNTFKKKYIITFRQTYLSKPIIQENNDVIKPLYPNEARLRGLTYSSPMFVDVEHQLIVLDDNNNVITDTKAIESKIPFMKIPVMLHSKYCHLSNKTEVSLREMGECEYDQGGYFVVNGGEKVLIAQERMAENQVFCWNKSSNNKYSHEAEVKSSIDQRFYPVKMNKILLTKEPSARAVADAVSQGKPVGRCLRVHIPQIKDQVPLFIVFRALGVVNEQQICQMIIPEMETIGPNWLNFLVPSIEEARSKGVVTQEQALNYIARLVSVGFSTEQQTKTKDLYLKYVQDLLQRELFPHITTGITNKAYYLSYMTRRLMDAYFGVRNYDDRDHSGNKRVDLSGPLLTALFRYNFINLVKLLKQQILPKLTDQDNGNLVNSLRKIIQGCGIESKIKYGLATGNWNTQKSTLSTSKKGIAQVLNRLSAIGALSHTRRVQSPLERSGSKIVAPRRLHGTQFGMCCPNETPEGAQVGIVKNLALQTQITIQTSDYPIRMALKHLGMTELINVTPSQLTTGVKIFVNGEWFGLITEVDAKRFYDKLITLKRHGVIVPHISIAWFIEWKELVIQTDGGRYSRPLYIVDNNQLLVAKKFQDNPEFRKQLRQGTLKWSELLGIGLGTASSGSVLTVSNGAVVEYLDTNELETKMVAMTIADIDANKSSNPKYVHYTHSEIHPMMMMAVTPAMIPFSDRSQSPRNCYQSSMGKQAIGTYVTNYNQRMDTLANVLVYGHKPLVATRTMKYIYIDKLPHGCTAQLLYACYAYNQEDSVCLNGDAVNRGFFNSIYFRTYKDKEQKHKSMTTANEKFTKPNKASTRDIKHGSYSAIDDNGVPVLGRKTEGGDVIIGKIIESKDTDALGLKQKDASTIVRANEHGVIDMVIPNPNADYNVNNYNAEGHRFIAARVSNLRKPELGDKFASRYAQKGTNGMMYSQVDLPFTNMGQVPDIIINSHGIPSRMTVNKLIETMLGKVAVNTGKVQDATPFTPFNIKDFNKVLTDYGCHDMGYEVMYNGELGNMYEVQFFYGPTYYQRLKHMTADKYHSRSSGPVQLLTRQPTEGRSRDGGLRAGEMEVQAMIGHGASKLLKRKITDDSDLFQIFVSKRHESRIVGNSEKKIFKYNNANVVDDEVSEVQLPFAMCLLLDEIQSMGIDVRLHTGEVSHSNSTGSAINVRPL